MWAKDAVVEQRHHLRGDGDSARWRLHLGFFAICPGASFQGTVLPKLAQLAEPMLRRSARLNRRAK